MLFRILGGLLICAACGLLGLYMAHRGVARARHLVEFRRGLTALRSEIAFAAYALPQAFANISQKAGYYAGFYNTLSQRLGEKEMDVSAAWEAGFNELKDSHLTKEDTDALRALGQALGSIDTAVQLRAIDDAIAALDDVLSRLNAQNAKDGKMYRRLGVLGGVLITIVLL